MSRFRLAIQDLKKGTVQHPVWIHLGWSEIKQRYHRSVIGPWWITLSMAVFILVMSLVFSKLFHQPLEDYIPFFTAGFLFWTFISSSIVEATEVFRSNAGFIKQINLPYSLYVFKHLFRHIILLMHNFVVYFLVCVFFRLNPGVNVFFVLPGFFLLLINLYWLCLVIGLLCSRYRDVAPIIGTCIQIAFFVTPISWMPRLLEGHSVLLYFNPLVYLLDVVRSPLLGFLPSLTSWFVVGGMAVGGCIFSLTIFSRSRSRIAFWVD